MREIPLTRGYAALVDDEDYERLVAMGKWHARIANGHVSAAKKSARPNRHNVHMHRVILSAGDDELVDHRNRNSLDNRRANLRRCSHEGNAHNSGDRGARSGFKGVRPDGRLFQAYITFAGKFHYLGLYPTAEEAARVRDVAAQRLQGDFAFLNFADGPR